MQYFQNKSIKNFTSLKIGGEVRQFYSLENITELKNLLISIPEYEKHKIRILGGGTNLLVKDDEILDLIVLKLEGEFQNFNVNKNEINASAGVLLPSLVKEILKQGFGGIEILAGIPGTVGGAVVGNVGGKYGDISKFVKNIQVMDYHGNIENLDKKDIIFQYRKTFFENFENFENKILLNINFDISSFSYAPNSQESSENFAVILDEKVSTQPYNTRNAGCIFKNIPDAQESVSKIIDDIGLKGTRIGDVSISEKHANFFIAGENARYADFMDLMNFVRVKVKAFKNFDIESEIKIWS